MTLKKLVPVESVISRATGLKVKDVSPVDLIGTVQDDVNP